MKASEHNPDCSSRMRIVSRNVRFPVIRHPFTGRVYFGVYMDIRNRKGQRMRVDHQNEVDFSYVERCNACDQILRCSGSSSTLH